MARSPGVASFGHRPFQTSSKPARWGSIVKLPIHGHSRNGLCRRTHISRILRASALLVPDEKSWLASAAVACYSAIGADLPYRVTTARARLAAFVVDAEKVPDLKMNLVAHPLSKRL